MVNPRFLTIVTFTWHVLMKNLKTWYRFTKTNKSVRIRYPFQTDTVPPLLHL